MRRQWFILGAALLVVAVVVRYQNNQSGSLQAALTPRSICAVEEITPGDFYSQLLTSKGRPVSSVERDGFWIVNNWGRAEKVWFKRNGGPNDWMVHKVLGSKLTCDGRVVVKQGDDWNQVRPRFDGLVSPQERCFYLDSDKPGTKIGIAVILHGGEVGKVSLEEVRVEE